MLACCAIDAGMFFTADAPSAPAITSFVTEQPTQNKHNFLHYWLGKGSGSTATDMLTGGHNHFERDILSTIAHSAACPLLPIPRPGDHLEGF